MTDQLVWEPLEYDPRYYIQTAKNNITSLGHVIAEAVSNADEAISRRAKFDKIDDAGTITIIFDPETTDLTVIDDGIGMTSGEIDLRLSGSVRNPWLMPSAALSIAGSARSSLP